MMLRLQPPDRPLALADLIGLDTLLSVMDVFYKAVQRLQVPSCTVAAKWSMPVSAAQERSRVLPLQQVSAVAPTVWGEQSMSE